MSSDNIGNPLVENTTTAAAIGAVTSPAWLHYLQSASDMAATVAPILGALWLAVQIGTKLYSVMKASKG
ncbi:MAG: hypothetical protein ACTHJ3_19580 [Pararhizobium sp.]